jgi:tungstate transport system substrate-binding protein
MALTLVVLFTVGCSEYGGNRTSVLRIAVTTSTRDTGLLDVVVPMFEVKHGVRVDVIAVGTGQALKFGENGDVDVVWVHAHDAELQFVRAGHGVRREDVMFNHFEILGPFSDPAGIKGMQAVPALKQIAAGGHRFVSRGDDSGTHRHERRLWESAGGLNAWEGYVEAGQGMGRTLVMADQMLAYTISDRGTYLAFTDKIELKPLTTSGDDMRNPYGAIAVNPEKSPQINHELANLFLDFLIGAEGQKLISGFRIAAMPVFHPHHLETK